jgi:hypothetical protein
LTSLFNNNFDDATIPAADPATAAPKKHGLLPLLTVLFLISYGLMTMLIVEQGRTIDSQRFLIRELFRDSTELSALRQAQMAKSGAAARAHSPAAKTPMAPVPSTQVPFALAPSTQTPLTQAPLTQEQAKQTPSSQAVPQHQARKQNQKQFQMPSRPASDLADENRALFTI